MTTMMATGDDNNNLDGNGSTGNKVGADGDGVRGDNNNEDDDDGNNETRVTARLRWAVA